MAAQPRPSATLPRKIGRIQRLMQAGEYRQANELCDHLLRTWPGEFELLMLSSHILQAMGDFDRMMVTAQQAFGARPESLEARARLAECLLYTNQLGLAIDCIRALEEQVGGVVPALTRVGEFYQNCGRFEDALRVQLRCVELEPKNSRLAADAATSCVVLGRAADAEKLFDRAIYLDPKNYDAWESRSALRKQTADNHHAQQLGFVLENLPEGDSARIPVYYALSKELEDLGEYDTAFDCLRSGARLMAERVNYDVSTDERALDHIARIFDGKRLATGQPGFEDANPILLVGLPRIGIALANRLLASLDGVASLGPVNTLIFALIHGVGPHQKPEDVIDRAGDIDFQRMGQRYWTGLRGLAPEAPNLVDCTPLNFQHLGLVSKAMPNARVIHLRRHPLDSCYTLYRTLFRGGHGFANRMDDIARYFVAYQQLMGHWRRHLPGWILDVDYEKLIADPMAQMACIQDFLGTDAEIVEGQLQAIMQRSQGTEAPVGVWREYREQLKPLATLLRTHGVPVDG
ncbi:hypothetical protein F3N42_02410 [Marinihelvus fidelis]|uniref:Uncharacterized protein n=1 Tax=Marinihelvus fidelis TaxID=2613842 RepID=A0A5N0TDX0_9GAMM|nr:sulfotransferase [Marinihelvus fidelis]KAA9133232.1 hypothetical protein F3N42_02410 [Marinihelvus fidelis]